ncbi:acyl-CoA carboxylase subunit beta, partial [Bacillus vallismortis]|nr:acyl-CoA carboxylase subunit beta [Bacillus vallismortis]
MFLDYDKERSERAERIRIGGAEKYHHSNQEKGKLFVSERLALLFDDDIELEDAFFAECLSDGLPADGGITA